MKKRLKLFLLIFCVAALCFCSVSADIGNSFDDGGGDWGGGFDYDYGNDWGNDYDNDWGNDYDNNWGNDYDYNSGRNDYDYDYDGFSVSSGMPSVSIVALVIVVILVVLLSKRARGMGGVQSSGKMTQQGNPNARNLYGEAVTDEDSIIAAIRKDDPDFSAADFKAYVEDCYLRLTEAWESRDWAIARNFESDTLFNVHRGQLEEYIEQKKTNHMDGQCVLSKVLTGYRSDGKTDSVIVRLNATVIDYVTDDETGAILSGSKTQRMNRFYRLEFIRSTGTKTAKDHGLTSHECPSCGAPLNLNASGRCEYCQNVITSGDFTWVLNAYGRWN